MCANGLVVDGGNPDLGLRHHPKIGPRILDITGFATPRTEKLNGGANAQAMYARGAFDASSTTLTAH